MAFKNINNYELIRKTILVGNKHNFTHANKLFINHLVIEIKGI